MKSKYTTNREDLWALLKPHLQSAGFVKFKGNCAFAFRADRIDVVELRLARLGKNAPYRMKPNCFEIEAGVFFRFAPHPMDAIFDGEDGLSVNSAMDGHFRTWSSPSLFFANSFRSSFWRAGEWSLRNRFVLLDVEKNLKNYLIPWFSKFDDLDAVQTHVLKVQAAGFDAQRTERKVNPWGEVYGFKVLPAFFALRLERWPDAKERLLALIDEPHPGHKIDPQKVPEHLYHNIEHLLREALATAESHLTTESDKT